MASKAQKLKSRRDKRRAGRPCKQDVARTKSGRISYANDPGEAPDVLARRKRVEMHGANMDEDGKAELMKMAGVQEMGTVIGRLKLSHEISPEQFSALQRFGELAARYRSVMGVPDSLKKTNGGGVMRVADDESEIEVRRKWKDVTKAVSEGNKHHNGNLMSALSYMVVRDEYHDHLLGDTRIAANILVRFYGLQHSSC